ncbi:MAG: His/Gly/Thr/Pro-type tRNA ligase C-terminal domain-containing protein [Chitinispirillia bacterium]|jgi:threonyl-tRNA synthetase
MSNNIKNRDEIAGGIRSKYLILFSDGKEIDIHNRDNEKLFKQLENCRDKELKDFIISEHHRSKINRETPSIKEMQRQRLVDYEPASDSGHFRLYPKGNLIFELLKDWAYEIAVNRFHALHINTPLLFDWSDNEIRQQAGSFHENHYIVKTPDNPEKELILRFSGDFGLFKVMKNANVSYRHLPLRIYEFSKSFRYERSGSLSGLKRLRAFHMPDIHCFCRDVDQAWEEYEHLYRCYSDLADGVDLKYAICFRICGDFYNRYKERICKLLYYSNKPAYIEILSEMKHYWIIKHEFQAIDYFGGSVQLSTVQLDIKDSDIYGIYHSDKDGKKKGCTICHSSIGSIERWMYTILEEALKKEKPILPAWLAPTQLRIIPVSKEFLDYCLSLDFCGIRFDIDDLDDSLGKKIARSNKNWVPFVAVVGQKEIDSKSFEVNIRRSGKQVNISFEEITELIKKEIRGFPFRKNTLSKLLSNRPVFFDFSG